MGLGFLNDDVKKAANLLSCLILSRAVLYRSFHFLHKVFIEIHVQGQCLVPMASSENLYGGCYKFSESARVGFYTGNL